jgi:AraC-like DNA-binding protein
MPLSQLDIIVRVAGATLLLVAVSSSDRRMGRAWRFFVPLAFCICGFLAGNTVDPALRLSGPLAVPAAVLAGYAAVFLWWFCLAVFDSSFTPRGPVLAVGLLWLVVASLDRGVFTEVFADQGLSWLLIGMGVAMVVHLSWCVLRDRDGDLVDERRRLRHVTVAVLAGQLLADLAVDLFMGMEWHAPWFAVLQNLALLSSAIWLLRIAPIATRARQAETTEPLHKLENTDSTRPDTRLLARLHELIDRDRVHLDPNLTFAQFVRAMGASERNVRRLINEQLGFEHFRGFLNAHRVAEARRLLADPAHRGDKLFSIALASGFSSLATFNRVFRDIAGQPPSAFRLSASARSAAPTGAPTGAQPLRASTAVARSARS